MSWPDTVAVWGTGSPKREFLHVDELADTCCFLMNTDFPDEEYKNNPLYNIGTGTDISICSDDLQDDRKGFWKLWPSENGSMVFRPSEIN